MDVFGIPIFAANAWKNSTNIAKLNHVASIMAELIDNDNDGCADDTAALTKLLSKSTVPAIGENAEFSGKKPCMLLLDGGQTTEMDTQVKSKGYYGRKSMHLYDIQVSGSGLNYGKDGKEDATIEEVYHLMNSDGHVLAHPKELGIGWTSNSLLTKAMDIAR